MISSVARIQALQELASQRQKHTPQNFPSLFHLTIQTCISHLQIFATLEGLPFHPFGQALYAEFTHRSTQWRLTTEQRQAGIILFAEAYGAEFLGPEYTGLRCSLVKDIPYLGSFAYCLVYLDLSGGIGTGGGGGDDPDSIGFIDKDMAGLSALSQLRFLNLAQLRISDTGLSHLVRSVTFGSSGPAKLEYLNLSGTDVTDIGLARIFGRQEQQHQQKQPVFKRLLGIDLTNSKVHEEVAESFFQGYHSAPWRRLPSQTILFPELTTSERNKTVKDNGTSYYNEQGSDINPMQRWVDRLNRIYNLSFAQRPDFAKEDGVGLSECLALAKLGQIYLHPLSDPVPQHQLEYQRRGEEFKMNALMRRMCSKRNRRYVQELEGVMKAMKKEKAPAQQTELDHMFNLNTYQKILNAIRSTFGTLYRPRSSKKGTTGAKGRLAFVRSRSDVEMVLDNIGEDEITPSRTVQDTRALTLEKNSDGVVKAKIKSRYDRPTAPSIPKLPTLPTDSAPPPKQRYNNSPESPFTSSSPFLKKAKVPTLPFIKLEPIEISDNRLSGRGRGANSFVVQHQPFVKPALEQTSRNIFMTTQPAKVEEQQPTMPPKTSAKALTRGRQTSSASMMESWVMHPKSTTSTPSKISSFSGKKRTLSDTRTNSGSQQQNIIRDFRPKEENQDTVNLDRWIRSGSVVRGGKNMSENSNRGGDGPPRKVIRFDSKDELFADKNDLHSTDEFQDT
ncbi:hypothetical protein BC939DRAFT_453041 [Gamsiella multidivaricata]|uniref:uncharacterized protein n=1 Tax=Gamsiella multidivaricata TaxID=101098 RepID=UPI00221ECA5C|nr:uncharacterized protein BC939DRAFT_453041 [Gamsiella multidivaricata]KAG0370871.1 hypothetical protein BGZ54_003297 [Gamsiella multidivaricata]KAI7822929.1 hypothetical protein BC939DRAFT_453041 [Gamsiella multidivaricata]